MAATIQTILFLLAVLAVVAAVARRLDIAPSILLVVAGIALAVIPGLPRIALAPQLVLLGFLPPLPPDYAKIPQSAVLSLPHYGAEGCRVLHITPTDIVDGKVIDPAPADFNPRPSTNPGVPANGGWPSN